jgi:5-methylcytosine-specific restriction endonuclease McrA
MEVKRVAMSGVLVIDQTYRPVDYIYPNELWKAATKLIMHEAFPVPGATIIATYRSPSTVVEIPSIISLKVYVPIPKKLSRHVTNTLLFARDNWTCQYCGRHKRELNRGEKLTRDHMRPQSLFKNKSDANTWDNVTTACSTCNNIKDNKLPYQCGMYPKTTPKRPNAVLVTIVDRLDGEQLEFVERYHSRL